MIVRESLEFKRGQNSKGALNVGHHSLIKKWLEKAEADGVLRDYEINEDFTIDTWGRVDFRADENYEWWHGKNLPDYIQFNTAHKSRNDERSTFDYFTIAGMGFTSLRGMPYKVEGDFVINHNPLVYLDGCPKFIGRNFFLENLKLKGSLNLKGVLPDTVGGNVYIFQSGLVDVQVEPAIPNLGGDVITKSYR